MTRKTYEEERNVSTELFGGRSRIQKIKIKNILTKLYIFVKFLYCNIIYYAFLGTNISMLIWLFSQQLQLSHNIY